MKTRLGNFLSTTYLQTGPSGRDLLCVGMFGVWGVEGAETTAGVIVFPPSTSDVGTEPRRTTPSRSVNLVAAVGPDRAGQK